MVLENQIEPISIIEGYADNMLCYRQLQISLSPDDWFKFETQPFYHQLIEWVWSLENSESAESEV